MKTIQTYILEDKLCLKHTSVYSLVDKMHYEYFHSDYDAFGDAQSTLKLAKIDEALIQESQKYPNKPFCHTSPFLRGCVRISRKEPS